MSCFIKPSTLALLSALAFIAISVLNAHQICEEKKSQGEVREISIEGCPDKEKICQWELGTNKRIKITFTPKIKFNEGRLTVADKPDFKVKIPFKKEKTSLNKQSFFGGSADPCRDHGITCPLFADQEYTMDFEHKAQSWWFAVEVDKHFRLVTKNKEQIFCIHFMTQLNRGTAQAGTSSTGEKADEQQPSETMLAYLAEEIEDEERQKARLDDFHIRGSLGYEGYE